MIRTGASELYPEVPEHLEAARDEEHRRLLEASSARRRRADRQPRRDARARSRSSASAAGRRYDERGRGAAGGARPPHRRVARQRPALRRAQLHRQDAPGEPAARPAARDPRACAPPRASAPAAPATRSAATSTTCSRPRRQLAVVVGDVCGKGPDAAAVTALARYTLRAAAMREPRPRARACSMLNEALLQPARRPALRHRGLRLARARERRHARGRRERRAIPCRCCCAPTAASSRSGRGHAGGRRPDPTSHDDGAHLGQGDSLVFYTDGVTEARDETGMLGEDSASRAPALLRRHGRRRDRGGDRGRPRWRCRRARRATTSRSWSCRPPKMLESSEKWVSRPREWNRRRHDARSSAPSDGKGRLSPVTSAAARTAAGRARRELSRLRADLDPPLLENVRLLVTELVTNSVRHAGRRRRRADGAGRRAQRVRVEIANPGAALRAGPRRDPSSDGGWGLFLVDRLSDAWGVVEDDGRHQRVWFELGARLSPARHRVERGERDLGQRSEVIAPVCGRISSS